MKIISLFSGIGAFEKALTNLNIDHEIVHYCEIDKYAAKAYSLIHGVDQSKNLGDITKIEIEKLPTNIDLITHGSPCQDFSIAGKGLGADGGTRSSLMWNSVEIIKHCTPKYVIWENVKNVLSKTHKHNFDKYVNELGKLGYKSYYQVLNAKNYGIPQNRERIFVVSILGEHDPLIFPEPFDNGLRLRDLLENEVDEKFYISQEKTNTLISQMKNKPEFGGVMVSEQATHFDKNTDVAGTLLARDYKGFGNQQMTAVCQPCLTPDRVVKRQNGRRFKENDEPAFTITTQDRHGVLINKRVCEQRTDEGLRFFKGDVCGTLRTIDACGDKRVIECNTNSLIKADHLTGGKWDKMHDSARRVYSDEGVAPTIPTCQGGNTEPKVKQDYRIRKLTPRECWRLMGFGDEDINKCIDNGISNSQLYKMAGNSIVVNVLMEIYKKLF